MAEGGLFGFGLLSTGSSPLLEQASEVAARAMLAWRTSPLREAVAHAAAGEAARGVVQEAFQVIREVRGRV